jgi:hypothetical protein
MYRKFAAVIDLVETRNCVSTVLYFTRFNFVQRHCER